jgi:hypothetical protein
MAEVPQHKQSLISKLFGFELLALTLGEVGFAAFCLLSSHELRSKSEWGCLQGVEYEWRYRSTPTYPLLQKRHGYRVACVPSAEGQRRIWILLTPKFEPLYKQMPPNLDYRLTVRDLTTITGYCSVHPIVTAELQRHTF